MTANIHHGRIGPNSIIRVAEALEAAQGRAAVTELFQRADLSRYLDAMPSEMVLEGEAIALQQALRAQLGISAARAVARDAGLRTGDYLLAKRIPRSAQRLLKILPARLAARVLLKAIRGNAWTFVGTGVFDAEPKFPPMIFITNSLICRGETANEPLCDYYVGTFERLFRQLVHKRAVVTEIACHAKGDRRCVFEVHW
ncbi:bacteriochlorophyll 4-vinyl reductase [Chromatium weissei]|nr:bacteriochlorophyll 4-vinyl reductase [Chromatium weissei]